MTAGRHFSDGSWLAHYPQKADDTRDFAITVPMSAPVTAADRAIPSQWPSVKVAEAVCRGWYGELGEGWGEFMD